MIEIEGIEDVSENECWHQMVTCVSNVANDVLGEREMYEREGNMMLDGGWAKSNKGKESSLPRMESFRRRE